MVDFLTLFPYVVGLAGAVIIGLVIYFFYVKPKMDLPLDGERLIGNVTAYIPRGFGLFSGAMTTGRATVERMFTKLIQSEKDDAMKKFWEADRDFCLKFHIFAQKVKRETKILLFDTHPEDQRFLSFDEESGGFILHGLKDAKSVGKRNGWEFLGLKLSPEQKKFTSDENKAFELALKSIKHLQDASENKERQAILEEEVGTLTRIKEQLHKDVREANSDREAFALIANKKNLLRPPTEKVPGRFGAVMKQWITLEQLAVAGLLYFASPHILNFLNIRLTEPALSYALIGFAIIGYFIIPLVRNIKKRLF